MNRIRKIKSRVTIALSLLILAAILIAALTSCEVRNGPNNTYTSNYKVYTIDSCEYITIDIASGFHHKGNCRHCQHQQQAQLDTLLNQIFD